MALLSAIFSKAVRRKQSFQNQLIKMWPRKADALYLPTSVTPLILQDEGLGFKKIRPDDGARLAGCYWEVKLGFGFSDHP